ncbi:hypothetical protein [Aestuariivirga litoralis]|uniref:hypothetical protein n=1 Tax=Aestuariivirga litoralis TaxID=2650924 RepID=UPI0018C65DD2|nr:hypothetical protein [Aestuariivirga litoralis]MBG1233976.1 hypothetical protein [Aestuariivirga litoralis]
MIASTVIGYHGTTTERVAGINTGFQAGKRAASWLGEGIYFFYNAPLHAENWSKTVAKRKTRTGKPVVITANITLGNTLNLLDSEHWDRMRAIANILDPNRLKQLSPKALYLKRTPKNLGENVGDHYLMEAYINWLEDETKTEIDTVIAAFIEGKPIHPDSWLFDQSHVAISVRTPGRIEIQGQQIFD